MVSSKVAFSFKIEKTIDSLGSINDFISRADSPHANREYPDIRATNQCAHKCPQCRRRCVNLVKHGGNHRCSQGHLW